MAKASWTNGRPERSVLFGRIEIKKAGEGEGEAPEGSFGGYATLFDVAHPTSAWQLPPDWMDVLAPGCFARTMAEHKRLGTMPALLWQHDMNDPIGAWSEMLEDDVGLRGSAQLCVDGSVPNGSRAYSLMKMGGIRGLSIGFSPAKATLDEKNKTRTILDTDLYETSVVTIPAVPGALVDDVKRRFDPRNPREMEAALRDAGACPVKRRRSSSPVASRLSRSVTLTSMG
jgi:HK97 family phage prohead protease